MLDMFLYNTSGCLRFLVDHGLDRGIPRGLNLTSSPTYEGGREREREDAFYYERTRSKPSSN